MSKQIPYGEWTGDPYDSAQTCGCVFVHGEQIHVCPDHQVRIQMSKLITARESEHLACQHDMKGIMKRGGRIVRRCKYCHRTDL